MAVRTAQLRAAAAQKECLCTVQPGRRNTTQVRMGIAILHSDMKEKLRTTYFAGRRSAETAPDNPLRGGYNRRCCRRRNNGSSEKQVCECCHLLNLLIEPIPQAFDQVEVPIGRNFRGMHTCNLARILQRRWSSVPPCVPSS